jgi:hypothetical protein
MRAAEQYLREEAYRPIAIREGETIKADLSEPKIVHLVFDAPFSDVSKCQQNLGPAFLAKIQSLGLLVISMEVSA